MDYQLHVMDCLEFMSGIPDDTFDVTFTSPPYNLVKENSGGSTTKMGNLDKKYETWYPDEMDEDEYQKWQKKVLWECMRVTKGSVFYNHKVRYAWARRGTVYHPMDWLSEFPLWTEIIWDRGGAQGGNSGRWLLADERIYQLGRPKVWHGKAGTNVWRIPPTHVDNFPCAFPVELVLRAIIPTTDEGDTVFDPFAGSGSTGVAALRAKRKFVGTEINPEYAEIVIERLENV